MRGPRWAPPLPDLMLAAGLWSAKVALLALGLEGAAGATRYLLAPVWTLPLAWRCSRPLTVALLVAGAGTAEAGLVGYRDSAVGLAVLVIATYSVAVHASGPVKMLSALAAIVAAVAVYDVAQYRQLPPSSRSRT